MRRTGSVNQSLSRYSLFLINTVFCLMHGDVMLCAGCVSHNELEHTPQQASTLPAKQVFMHAVSKSVRLSWELQPDVGTAQPGCRVSLILYVNDSTTDRGAKKASQPPARCSRRVLLRESTMVRCDALMAIDCGLWREGDDTVWVCGCVHALLHACRTRIACVDGR